MLAFLSAIGVFTIFLKILNRPRLRKVNGDTVLITGCSSGIGREVALNLNERGFLVFAGVRKQSDADSLKQEVKYPVSKNSNSLFTKKELLFPVILDVTKDEEIKEAFKAVTNVLGERELNAVFCNAGISQDQAMSKSKIFDTAAETIEMEVIQKILDVNFFGAVRIIQTFFPLLQKSKGILVVNSSLSATVTLPFMGPYGASKAALQSYIDALRRETKKFGVKICIIEAGGKFVHKLSYFEAVRTSLTANFVSNRKWIETSLNTKYPEQLKLHNSVATSTTIDAVDAKFVAKEIGDVFQRINPPTRLNVGSFYSIKWIRVLPDWMADWLCNFIAKHGKEKMQEVEISKIRQKMK